MAGAGGDGNEPPLGEARWVWANLTCDDVSLPSTITFARLIGHLNGARGDSFEVIGHDVPVSSGENFDYRLETAGAQPVAVEIYRLAEGEELAALAMWQKVIDSLKKELEGRNLSGYIISAPQQFTLRKAGLAAVVKELAEEIANAITGASGRREVHAGPVDDS